MVKVLNAIPSLLQLLKTDSIAANGIVNRDVECLCFLRVFWGCLVFFVVLFFKRA